LQLTAPTVKHSSEVRRRRSVRNVQTRPHGELRRFAEETGGRYFEVTPSIDLKGEIVRATHEMFRPDILTFTPAVLDGRSHKLEVQTARAGGAIDRLRWASPDCRGRVAL